MRFTMIQRAEHGAVFAPTAFSAMIGEAVPFTIEGRRIGDAVVVAAKVSDDGRQVELIVEAPDDEAVLGPGWMVHGGPLSGFTVDPH